MLHLDADHMVRGPRGGWRFVEDYCATGPRGSNMGYGSRLWNARDELTALELGERCARADLMQDLEWGWDALADLAIKEEEHHAI